MFNPVNLPSAVPATAAAVSAAALDAPCPPPPTAATWSSPPKPNCKTAASAAEEQPAPSRQRRTFKAARTAPFKPNAAATAATTSPNVADIAVVPAPNTPEVQPPRTRKPLTLKGAAGASQAKPTDTTSAMTVTPTTSATVPAAAPANAAAAVAVPAPKLKPAVLVIHEFNAAPIDEAVDDQQLTISYTQLLEEDFDEGSLAATVPPAASAICGDSGSASPCPCPVDGPAVDALLVQFAGFSLVDADSLSAAAAPAPVAATPQAPAAATPQAPAAATPQALAAVAPQAPAAAAPLIAARDDSGRASPSPCPADSPAIDNLLIQLMGVSPVDRDGDTLMEEASDDEWAPMDIEGPEQPPAPKKAAKRATKAFPPRGGGPFTRSQAAWLHARPVSSRTRSTSCIQLRFTWS